MTSTALYRRLGIRLCQERLRHNLSQEELSFLSRIDRTYIARIEEGKANPSVKVLHKLSRPLRTRLSELLKGV